MKLSIVIVNYNVRPFLLQTVDAAIRACQGLDAEVWVVDNASSDDSVEKLQALYPEVRLICNEDNVGFAKANNAAIRQSDSEYVLLLNPDTIIGEDVLHGCVEFMDSHDEAGGIGVEMLNRNGSFAWESRRGVPTPATAFYKIFGLAKLYPTHRRFGHYHMRYLDPKEANRIEVMSGAFTFLRRSALEQVGMLDESFFMYGEDVDLSYRLLKGNWQNWYLPLRILHYKGESTQRTSFRYVRNFYRAMIIFYRKHYAANHRLQTLAVETAVFMVGALSMIEKLFTRATHFVAGLLQKAKGRLYKEKVEPYSPETMLFFGNRKGWEALQPLVRKANLATIFYDVSEAPDGHLSVEDENVSFTYVTYQTDIFSYSTILDLLSRGFEQGKNTTIGTFSLKTGTLILPNDIFE